MSWRCDLRLFRNLGVLRSSWRYRHCHGLPSIAQRYRVVHRRRDSSGAPGRSVKGGAVRTGLADEGDFDFDARFLYVRNPRKNWLAGMKCNYEKW